MGQQGNILATGAPDQRTTGLACCAALTGPAHDANRGAQADAALTFAADHSAGAEHDPLIHATGSLSFTTWTVAQPSSNSAPFPLANRV